MAPDDFFVTYRYAWNLAGGNGFVFNPGERVFGLTDPGLGLLLAALHLVTRLPIPWLGTAVTGAALVGIALVLLLDGRERGRTPEALVGGTLIVGSSFLWVNQGGGVFFALLFLLIAARLRSPVRAGLLAGLAVWMRPDAALGVGLLGLLLGIEKRRLPWTYLLAAGGVASAGVLAAWSWFGSPLPNTLAAKHAMTVGMTEVGSGFRGFWPRAFRLMSRHWGPWWTLMTGVGLAGHAAMLLGGGGRGSAGPAQATGSEGGWEGASAHEGAEQGRTEPRGGGRATRLLALVSLAMALAYPLLEVPFFSWYAVPTAVGVLYGVPYLTGALGRGLAARLGRRQMVGAAAATAILAPLLLSFVPATWRWHTQYQWQRHLRTYREAALWIRDHSAPQDALAYVEIGVMSFYSERPLVDLLGLVTPGAIPYVEADDLVGAFLAHPTRFVIHHSRGRMSPLIQRRWFPRAYEAVAYFHEGDGRGLTIYQRRPGSKLPRPRPPRERR